MEQIKQPDYDAFIEISGQTAEILSFNRSIGKIYGCLFMSSSPLSLDEITKCCHMSKGNASVHLRTLEGWGAVHRSWKSGTRKDYYTANTDLQSLAYRRIQEGIGRRLDYLRMHLNSIQKDPGQFSPDVAKRLDQLASILDMVEKGYQLLPKLYEMRHLLGNGFIQSLLEKKP